MISTHFEFLMYVLGAAFCQQIQIHWIWCLVFSVIEFYDKFSHLDQLAQAQAHSISTSYFGRNRLKEVFFHPNNSSFFDKNVSVKKLFVGLTTLNTFKRVCGGRRRSGAWFEPVSWLELRRVFVKKILTASVTLTKPNKKLGHLKLF